MKHNVEISLPKFNICVLWGQRETTAGKAFVRGQQGFNTWHHIYFFAISGVIPEYKDRSKSKHKTGVALTPKRKYAFIH